MIIEGLKYLFLSKNGMEPLSMDETIRKLNKVIKGFIEKIKAFEEISESDREIISNFATTLNEIASFAPKYDYDTIPHNGYRSIVKLWTQIMERGLNLERSDQVKEFISVINESKFLIDFCLDYNERNYANYYPNEDAKIIANGMSFLFKDGGRRWCMLNQKPFNFPQLAPSVRLAADFMRRYAAMHISDLTFFQRLRVFFSQEYMARKLSQTLTELTVDQIAYCARAFGETAHSKLLLIHRIESFFNKHQPKSTSIYPRLSSPYVIDISGQNKVALVKQEPGIASDQRSIHSQVIRTEPLNGEGENNLKKLVIFLHGGAFVAPKAAAAEHVYITPWSRATPGATFINFDYSLSPESRFPTQIQELLDFYLWLIGYKNSSDSVETLIGFVPNEIIFSGESAGGHLALSVTLILNDIKRTFDPNLKMPKSLVLMYPKVTLCYHQYPSSISSGWDLIIFPQLLPIVGQAYIPLIQDAQVGVDPEDAQVGVDAKDATFLKEKYSLDPNQNKKFKNGTDANQNQTFNGDANQNRDAKQKRDAKLRILSTEEQTPLSPMDIYRRDLNFLESSYLTALNYDKYEDLASISLKIMTFEFDPFLDESVCLAKRWKGGVDMKVFDNCCHAAVIFRHVSKEAKLAHLEAQRMIQTALDE